MQGWHVLAEAVVFVSRGVVREDTSGTAAFKKILFGLTRTSSWKDTSRNVVVVATIEKDSVAFTFETGSVLEVRTHSKFFSW